MTIHIKYFILFLLVFSLVNCDTVNSSDKSNPTNNNTDSTEKTNNWLIIPGKQVGRIQADFSADDIIKIFGEDNVVASEIGLGEGEMKMGLLVFPKTKNELQVLFEGEEKMEKLEVIRITEPGAMWKTASGIGVGTSLEKLVEVNGKHFYFSGFEWDYAGSLRSWNGGKLSERLFIHLEPTNEAGIFPDLIGNEKFLSDHPKAKEGELKVAYLEIIF